MVNTVIETGDTKKAIASCTQAVADIKKQLGL